MSIDEYHIFITGKGIEKLNEFVKKNSQFYEWKTRGEKLSKNENAWIWINYMLNGKNYDNSIHYDIIKLDSILYWWRFYKYEENIEKTQIKDTVVEVIREICGKEVQIIAE